jgi:hypothetical protein
MDAAFCIAATCAVGLLFAMLFASRCKSRHRCWPNCCVDAYTLSDRGTWLSFNNKGSLIVAIEGDPRLLNRYDVIELNPQKHAGPKRATAKVFTDWLISQRVSKQSARIK